MTTTAQSTDRGAAIQGTDHARAQALGMTDAEYAAQMKASAIYGATLRSEADRLGVSQADLAARLTELDEPFDVTWNGAGRFTLDDTIAISGALYGDHSLLQRLYEAQKALGGRPAVTDEGVTR